MKKEEETKIATIKTCIHCQAEFERGWWEQEKRLCENCAIEEAEYELCTSPADKKFDAEGDGENA